MGPDVEGDIVDVPGAEPLDLDQTLALVDDLLGGIALGDDGHELLGAGPDAGGALLLGLLGPGLLGPGLAGPGLLPLESGPWASLSAGALSAGPGFPGCLCFHPEEPSAARKTSRAKVCPS